MLFCSGFLPGLEIIRLLKKTWFNTFFWCSEEDDENEEEEAMPEDEESDVEDHALQVGGRRQLKSSLLFF